MRIKAIILLPVFAGLLLAPLSAMAQANANCTSTLYTQFKSLEGSTNGADMFPHFCDAPSAFLYVSQIALAAVGSVAIIFIMIGGFRIIIGSAGIGGEESLTSGKKTLTWSVIGLAVVLLAYAIVTVITNFLIKGTL